MSYRIKICRGEMEFEVEGDKKFILEMIQRYGEGIVPQAKQADGHKPAEKEPPRSKSAFVAPGKGISAGEFIRQLQFKKHTDMVVAFGYYLEKISGLSSFTPADINTCYYDAKLESSNTSQMIIRNIRRTLIMPARKQGEKGKKAYVLTRTGEEFVKQAIPQPAK